MGAIGRPSKYASNGDRREAMRTQKQEWYRSHKDQLGRRKKRARGGVKVKLVKAGESKLEAQGEDVVGSSAIESAGVDVDEAHDNVEESDLKADEIKREFFAIIAKYIHHTRNAVLIAPPAPSMEFATSYWRKFFGKLTSDNIAGWGRHLFDNLVRIEGDEEKIIKVLEDLESELEPAVAHMEDIARCALELDTFGKLGLYYEALFVKKLAVTVRDIVSELVTLRSFGQSSLIDAEKRGEMFFQEYLRDTVSLRCADHANSGLDLHAGVSDSRPSADRVANSLR